MVKVIEDARSRQYAKNLKALQKLVNQKPSEKVLEQLRQKYTEQRNEPIKEKSEGEK
jgi:hypothetical protein